MKTYETMAQEKGGKPQQEGKPPSRYNTLNFYGLSLSSMLQIYLVYTQSPLDFS